MTLITDAEPNPHHRHPRAAHLGRHLAAIAPGVLVTAAIAAAAVGLRAIPGMPGISPMLLAIVLGNLLEKNFIISMVKSNGNFMDFFNRPIAGSLAAVAILIWVFPLIRKIYKMATAKAA